MIVGPLVALMLRLDIQNETKRLAVRKSLRSLAQFSVPHLIEGLASGNLMLMRESAKTLEMIGPPAISAVPHLERARSGRDSLLRGAAKNALRTIKGESAIPSRKDQRQKRAGR